MTVDELAHTVTQQETARLTRVPGIGKKTAERLLLELRGKLGADIAHPAGSTPSGRDDILNALLSLGYSSSESPAALKKLPPGVDVAEEIGRATSGGRVLQYVLISVVAGSFRKKNNKR